MKSIPKLKLIFMVILTASIAANFTYVQAAVLKEFKQNKKQSEKFVPGEVLVKFKSRNPDSIRQTAKNKKLRVKKLLRKSAAVLTSPDNQTTEEMIAELKSDPNVEIAQPNYQYSPSDLGTNDTYKSNLWALENTGQTIRSSTGISDADIDAAGSDSNAWTISTGSGVIVAVIDTGVHFTHPDLAASMWDGSACVTAENGVLGNCQHGYDFEFSDKDPTPTSNSHGTHVAGTIAAAKNNNAGIAGVAPDAKIMALKTDLTTSEIVDAIGFATANGATIINASWGGSGNDLILKEAIAGFPGLFIAAAGNDSQNHATSAYYPCDYPVDHIICVASTDNRDNLSSFSDYGAATVDVGAPGTNIYSSSVTFSKNQSELLNETFEAVTVPSTPTGWTTTGTFGTKLIDSNIVMSGDVSNVPYAPNNSSILSLPPMDLNGASLATLQFAIACDTEYITTAWTDYLQLEFSDDNGATFNRIRRFDEAEIDDYNNESPMNGEGWATRQYEYNILNYYYLENFQMRFRWITNGSDSPVENYGGCYVDDININVERNIVNTVGYGYLSGTSMATPHVTGLAALLSANDPALTSAQIKDVILQTGDSISSLAGKTVTGKRINVFKALAATQTGPDTDAPIISAMENITAEATSSSGAVVTYTNPPTVDIDLTATATCLPASGSIFPLGETVVNCEASDSSGNTATPIQFIIIVRDTTAPSITLNGDITTTLTVGSTYTDLGATATDLVDGAVEVVATGEVNTAAAGTYMITYSATDTAGNTSTSTKTITVNAPQTSGGGGGGGGGGSTRTQQRTTSPTPTTQPAPILGATTTSAHPSGTLILSGQTVYLVKDGQRYGFRDAEEYKSHGYNFNQLVLANQNDLALAFNSHNIVKALEGTLVLDKSDGRTVYMIGSNGTKRGFASADVFRALGYQFINLPVINLTDYPAGSPIDSTTAAHPDGSLILDGQTIWWIRGNSKQGFESEAVFKTYGFSFDRVVPANNSDRALPQGPLVKFRDGTLVNDNGSYYIISNGQKLQFKSSAALTDRGYSLSNLITGSLSSYSKGAVLE